MDATNIVTTDNTAPTVVRQYDIGGTKYIVTATVKIGANEDAVTKIRRLIRNEIIKKL
jgi:hypothetical protein